ncbi:hypothetical protein AAVH_19391, partial [Aphelenchoides avenae]
ERLALEWSASEVPSHHVFIVLTTNVTVMRFLQPAGVHKIGDNAFIFEDGGKYVQLSTRTDDKRVCITRVILEIFGLKVCGAVASSGLQGQPNGAPYVVAGADFIAFETAHSVAMK